MNHLFRDRAPITPAGWEEIEKEARRTLRALLAARRIVDFKGPLGWGVSDVELGRADPIALFPISSRTAYQDVHRTATDPSTQAQRRLLPRRGLSPLKAAATPQFSPCFAQSSHVLQLQAMAASSGPCATSRPWRLAP